MIKNIYSQNLGSNFVFNSKFNKVNASVPVQSTQNNNDTYSNYSVDNLKANFSPNRISFKKTFQKDKYENVRTKDGNIVKLSLPKNDTIVSISSINSSDRIKGDYYGELKTDLNVAIHSSKNVILEKAKGIIPETFIHSFANYVEEREAHGKKVFGKNAEIVYIKDPTELFIDAAISRRNNSLKFNIKSGATIDEIKKLVSKPVTGHVEDSLLDLAGDGLKNKIVFIDHYDALESLAINDRYTSIDELLKEVQDLAPNLSFVGLVDEPEKLDQKSSQMASLLGGGSKSEHLIESEAPRLALPGLSTKEAKEFLIQNPDYYKQVMDNFPDTKIKLTAGFIDAAVNKSALFIDGALPASAFKVMQMAIGAKLTNANADQDAIAMNGKDVKKLFLNHQEVLASVKAPADGRFNIAENITTKLKDVGGISSIIEDLQRDLIDYLKNPAEYIKNSGEAPKGFLLEGPPGTGKTLLARAIAGETDTPFISASGSEFVQKYVGEGAARVRELFASARKAAANSPNKTAIIFIDEFDALARQRSGGDVGSKEAEQTLNQLLTEMDGFSNKESKIKIVMLAATNRKDLLDEAAIRPGRFDVTFTVSNPRTNADRLEILNIHAKKLKFANEADKKAILEEAAKMTDNMSGAELMNVMKKAQKVVARRVDNKVITHNDMVEGLLQTISGPINKSGEERPLDDIVKTVRHEGGHATAIDFLKPLFNEKISFITLDPRGDFLGAVFHHSPRVNPNFKSVILSAAVSHAGGLAEPAFDSEGRAAGVRQDLNQATGLFRKAVTEWGQGIFTPPISLAPMDGNNEGKSADAFYQTMQNVNQKNIEKDINLFSKTSEKIAKMVTEFHNGFLDDYVTRFKENAGKGGNNLSGEEFSKLRQEWLVKSNNVEAEKKLLAKVEYILDSAYNSNSSFLSKITKRLKYMIK